MVLKVQPVMIQLKVEFVHYNTLELSFIGLLAIHQNIQLKILTDFQYLNHLTYPLRSFTKIVIILNRIRGSLKK